MEPLEIDNEAGEDAIVVRVAGDVDSSTVDQLSAHLTDALGLARAHPARLLIVDLLPVTFFGSAGLNAVLDCHEQGLAAAVAVGDEVGRRCAEFDWAALRSTARSRSDQSSSIASPSSSRIRL